MNNNLMFLLPFLMNGSVDFGKMLPEMMKGGNTDPMMLLFLSVMSGKNKTGGEGAETGKAGGPDMQKLLQMFAAMNGNGQDGHQEN